MGSFEVEVTGLEDGDTITVRYDRNSEYTSKSSINGSSLIRTRDGINSETNESNIIINGKKCLPCDALREQLETNKSLLPLFEKYCK